MKLLLLGMVLRNLALEFVQATEAAAIAAAEWIGRGDKIAADQAAVDAMRKKFNEIEFCGKVVIGEGKKDKAPELFVGEILGCKTDGEKFDIAVYPLEGTTPTASGGYNSMTVVAVGAEGSLLSAPDTYMDKIAVGPEARDVIDLDAPVSDNIKKTAHALGKDVSEVAVVVLDRDRHKDLIQSIRQAGARVRLIGDVDTEPAIATCLPERGIDMLMGIGASAEGVISATAVKMLGGQQLVRFKPRNPEDEDELKRLGIDRDQVFSADDLAKGDRLSFTATGVTDGSLLDGVLVTPGKIVTHSMVIRSVSGTVRYITTNHYKHLGK